MVETSKKKVAYNNSYNKKNTIIKPIRFNFNTEKDMLTYIENKDEKFSSYVKRLIKEDMEKEKPD